MPTQIATLRLPVTTNRRESLLSTAEQFRDSFSRVCAVGWDQPRINGVELHHKTYYPEKEKTQLSSQLIIAARMKATEALKAAKTRIKRGKKSSCPAGKTLTIRYESRSAHITLSKGAATLSTVDGRIKVSFPVCDYYTKYLAWKVCIADLLFDKTGKIWLNVVVSREAPVVAESSDVLGIDLGVNRPAVTSNNKFLGEKRWKNNANKLFNLRRALQAKGTKSAKRHLRKLRRKENRFRKDCDHVISRRIVDAAPSGSTVVLEDLTDIRDRVKGKKKQKRRLHSWSFSQLQQFIEYKALEKGISVCYVDPRYTSQKCSKCGHIDKKNRESQSWFNCKKCGFQHNADLNAAKTIRLNYLASKGISAGSGLLSTSPS